MHAWASCCTSGACIEFQSKICKHVNFYSIVKRFLHLTMHLLTAFASVWAVRVLMGNFNQSSLYRRDSTVGHRLFWRSWEYISFFIQVTEEQKRGAHWTSYSPARRGSLGMSKAAVTRRWWSLGSWKKVGGYKASSQPCTSGQQILAFPKGRVPFNKALEERVGQRKAG